MTNKEINNYLESAFDKYVPSFGSCETVGGEVVRACNRLIYRWFNDGDMIGVGYGNETCNAPARYIEHIASEHGVNLLIAEWTYDGTWEYGDEEKYEDKLYKQIEKVVKMLQEHPELFEEENFEDMYDYSDKSDSHWGDEEDEEDEW